MMEVIQESLAMVAVTQFIPDDPKEKESVLAVLRAHPELQDFIARASRKARELSPNVTIELDTVRYDDWDPPIRMLVHLILPWEEYRLASRTYIRWLTREPGFSLDSIAVMPMWGGDPR